MAEKADETRPLPPTSGQRATDEAFREPTVERVVLGRSITYRADAAIAASRVVERVLARIAASTDE